MSHTAAPLRAATANTPPLSHTFGAARRVQGMDTLRFRDRTDAGVQLAAHVAQHVSPSALVLGIPRGGVVVAAALASALGLPLGAITVRKLGAPGHEEFAVGAIAAGVRVIDDESLRTLRMSADALDAVERAERTELARRDEHYAAGLSWDAGGREVVLVDDGIATGSTASAACAAVRARGASRVLLATPVAPAEWRPDPDVVDEYFCLLPVRDFWAVGQFYDDFAQTSDAEVVRLLTATAPGAPSASAESQERQEGQEGQRRQEHERRQQG